MITLFWLLQHIMTYLASLRQWVVAIETVMQLELFAVFFSIAVSYSHGPSWKITVLSCTEPVRVCLCLLIKGLCLQSPCFQSRRVLRNSQGGINKKRFNESPGMMLRIMNLRFVVNRSHFEKCWW